MKLRLMNVSSLLHLHRQSPDASQRDWKWLRLRILFRSDSSLHPLGFINPPWPLTIHELQRYSVLYSTLLDKGVRPLLMVYGNLRA